MKFSPTADRQRSDAGWMPTSKLLGDRPSGSYQSNNPARQSSQHVTPRLNCCSESDKARCAKTQRGLSDCGQKLIFRMLPLLPTNHPACGSANATAQ